MKMTEAVKEVTQIQVNTEGQALYICFAHALLATLLIENPEKASENLSLARLAMFSGAITPEDVLAVNTSMKKLSEHFRSKHL